MEIDISSLKTADVLAALYNAARCGGGPFAPRQYTPEDMTLEAAQSLINEIRDTTRGEASRQRSVLYFDYLRGRVMKVDISGPMLDPRLYDRDNGEGAARRALEPLLDLGKPPTAWERLSDGSV